MKILLINWIYDSGSTGYIVRDLKNALFDQGHEVYVAAGICQKYTVDDVFLFSSPNERLLFWRLQRCGWPYFHGSTKSSKRLIKYIKKIKPDIVNIHLLNSNVLNFYYLLEFLGKNHIKTVITNHAEVYYTGSCAHSYDCDKWITSECRNCLDRKYATGSFFFGRPHYMWKRMKKSFDYFAYNDLLFTAVSPWVKDRFLQSPIVNSFRCEVVLNGLNTESFYPRLNNAIIDKFGKKDMPYILWVTANFCPSDKDDTKGGYYLVELAKLMPEMNFVIVASRSSGVSSLPNNIFMWGKAKDQEELSCIYSSALLTVVVSRRETFSMVTAESLCCGTPVVGFKAGGPESIAIPEYSLFVEQGNVIALAEVIKVMQNRNFDRQKISNDARKLYCPQNMAHNYVNAYNKLLV